MVLSWVLSQVEKGIPVGLLWVVHHQGSSPGRAGFWMAVSAEDMCGSVGGGILEHKFVELARHQLSQRATLPILRRQVHLSDTGTDRSGMICSGEQTMLVYFPTVSDIAALRQVYQGHGKGISVSPHGIQVLLDAPEKPVWEKSSEDDWHFRMPLGFRRKVVIVGGGHVSLALSKWAASLGYHITVLDHREGLHTMEGNVYAHEKKVISLDDTSDWIPEDTSQFVVLMTFGYRTDAQALRTLRGRKFAYLGMLGAQAKIDTLWTELGKEGWLEDELKAIDAPAGLSIGSQTPDEIAVSILGKWIQLERELGK
jgi:xanthine dehydrogenase accessory factor